MKRKNNQIYLGVGQFNLEYDEENREEKRRNILIIYHRVGWLNFKDDEKVKMNGKDK